MNKTNTVLAALACLLSACASTGPATVAGHAGPEADLSGYESFGYLPRLGTDRQDRPLGERSGFSIRLIAPTSHELSRRGLDLANEPDLWVDFNFVPERGVPVRATPDGAEAVSWSHWSRPVTVWPGYAEHAAGYSRGSLLVSLIDRRRNMLVAEGYALGRSTNNVNNNDFTQGKVSTSVAVMFDDLMPLD